jgi:N-acetylneuraminate synthase
MTTKFIAEIGSNHNQDINRCYELIDSAAEIGCDAVKFQLFKISELFSKEILSKSETHRSLVTRELPIEFIPKLQERCHKRNIKFGCTPFYIDAVAELSPYVDFLKIASYELLWTDLLVASAKTNLPIIFSTGMATLEEAQLAYETIKANSQGVDISVMHCVSAYPAPADAANLACIKTLRDTLNIPCGWSDHTTNDGVLYNAALRWGANYIEFHYDLDGLGAEASHNHCWLPEKIAPIIKNINLSQIYDGSGIKNPTDGELNERDWRADSVDGLRPQIHARSTF